MIQRSLAALALSLSLSAVALAEPPKVTAVDPAHITAGEALAIQGENLDKKNVVEVYLTDGKTDTKLVVTGQTTAAIKATTPANTPVGRLRVMFLTGGANPQYLEQPVMVVVETASERDERLRQEKEAQIPPPETPAAPAPAPSGS